MDFEATLGLIGIVGSIAALAFAVLVGLGVITF
ncbi:hypothetical protein CLV72_11282 [Allonocardiopsis opalescens]|uniref:Uncharacterized protein n=1 Tax=Allonocardiopsis opalescens TaxID=1144618 RepID=A0A2T0PSY6_9ACTN|nr:hypothetical protein CLV72_11282 [Allonocardiopsis opalescens]